MENKLMPVFDDYSEHNFLVNIDHIVCINLEEGDIQLTGNRHIHVDNDTLQTIKDSLGIIENK